MIIQIEFYDLPPHSGLTNLLVPPATFAWIEKNLSIVWSGELHLYQAHFQFVHVR